MGLEPCQRQYRMDQWFSGAADPIGRAFAGMLRDGDGRRWSDSGVLERGQLWRQAQAGAPSRALRTQLLRRLRHEFTVADLLALADEFLRLAAAVEALPQKVARRVFTAIRSEPTTPMLVVRIALCWHSAGIDAAVMRAPDSTALTWLCGRPSVETRRMIDLIRDLVRLHLRRANDRALLAQALHAATPWGEITNRQTLRLSAEHHLGLRLQLRGLGDVADFGTIRRLIDLASSQVTSQQWGQMGLPEFTPLEPSTLTHAIELLATGGGATAGPWNALTECMISTGLVPMTARDVVDATAFMSARISALVRTHGAAASFAQWPASFSGSWLDRARGGLWLRALFDRRQGASAAKLLAAHQTRAAVSPTALGLLDAVLPLAPHHEAACFEFLGNLGHRSLDAELYFRVLRRVQQRPPTERPLHQLLDRHIHGVVERNATHFAARALAVGLSSGRRLFYVRAASEEVLEDAVGAVEATGIGKRAIAATLNLDLAGPEIAAFARGLEKRLGVDPQWVHDVLTSLRYQKREAGRSGTLHFMANASIPVKQALVRAVFDAANETRVFVQGELSHSADRMRGLIESGDLGAIEAFRHWIQGLGAGSSNLRGWALAVATHVVGTGCFHGPSFRIVAQSPLLGEVLRALIVYRPDYVDSASLVLDAEGRARLDEQVVALIRGQDAGSKGTLASVHPRRFLRAWSRLPDAIYLRHFSKQELPHALHPRMHKVLLPQLSDMMHRPPTRRRGIQILCQLRRTDQLRSAIENAQSVSPEIVLALLDVDPEMARLAATGAGTRCRSHLADWLRAFWTAGSRYILAGFFTSRASRRDRVVPLVERVFTGALAATQTDPGRTVLLRESTAALSPAPASLLVSPRVLEDLLFLAIENRDVEAGAAYGYAVAIAHLVADRQTFVARLRENVHAETLRHEAFRVLGDPPSVAAEILQGVEPRGLAQIACCQPSRAPDALLRLSASNVQGMAAVIRALLEAEPSEVEAGSLRSPPLCADPRPAADTIVRTLAQSAEGRALLLRSLGSRRAFFRALTILPNMGVTLLYRAVNGRLWPQAVVDWVCDDPKARLELAGEVFERRRDLLADPFAFESLENELATRLPTALLAQRVVADRKPGIARLFIAHLFKQTLSGRLDETLETVLSIAPTALLVIASTDSTKRRAVLRDVLLAKPEAAIDVLQADGATWSRIVAALCAFEGSPVLRRLEILRRLLPRAPESVRRVVTHRIRRGSRYDRYRLLFPQLNYFYWLQRVGLTQAGRDLPRLDGRDWQIAEIARQAVAGTVLEADAAQPFRKGGYLDRAGRIPPRWYIAGTASTSAASKGIPPSATAQRSAAPHGVPKDAAP